jgi:hypothetical protein
MDSAILGRKHHADICGRKVSPYMAMMILSSLLLTMLSPGCIETGESHRYLLTFSSNVHADSPTTVIIPIPECARLQGMVRVYEGNGHFEQVTTEYGPAYRVETSKDIGISATWTFDDPALVPEMTNNLSTMDHSFNHSVPWDLGNGTLPPREVWICHANGGVPDVSITCRILIGNRYFEYIGFFYDLIPNWTKMPLENRVGKEYWD